MEQLDINFTTPALIQTKDCIFQIKGGMYPTGYRETFIRVTKVPVAEFPYDTAKKWCKTNFPDWNHIYIRYDEIKPEQIVATVQYTTEIPRFISRNNR